MGSPVAGVQSECKLLCICYALYQKASEEDGSSDDVSPQQSCGSASAVVVEEQQRRHDGDSPHGLQHSSSGGTLQAGAPLAKAGKR